MAVTGNGGGESVAGGALRVLMRADQVVVKYRAEIEFWGLSFIADGVRVVASYTIWWSMLACEVVRQCLSMELDVFRQR